MQFWINLILPPLIAAVVGVISYRLTEKYSKRATLNKDRLVRLLQPLYLVFIEMDNLYTVAGSSENYNTVDYFDELPESKEMILPILKDNLYLASAEMTKSGLEFLLWAEVERNNKKRFDYAMFGKQNDKPFTKLRELVIKEFQEEKRKFHK